MKACNWRLPYSFRSLFHHHGREHNTGAIESYCSVRGERERERERERNSGKSWGLETSNPTLLDTPTSLNEAHLLMLLILENTVTPC